MTDEETAEFGRLADMAMDVGRHAAASGFETAIRLIDPLPSQLRPIAIGIALGLMKLKIDEAVAGTDMLRGAPQDAFAAAFKTVTERAMKWELTEHGQRVGFRLPQGLGLIPSFLSPADPRPAKEQIDENYAKGGGWRPISSGVQIDPDTLIMTAPGDPPFLPMVTTKLRDERIVFYEPGSFLALFAPDGSYEVARVD